MFVGAYDFLACALPAVDQAECSSKRIRNCPDLNTGDGKLSLRFNYEYSEGSNSKNLIFMIS